MIKSAKSDRSLWQRLEEARELPAAHDLSQLSGLLDLEIARFQAAWAALPLDVRQELIAVLAQMTEADFEMDFSAIFRIAIHDPDALVRATAIEGLFELEDIRLISEFIALLQEDASEAVRVKASEALGNFVLLGELRKILPHPFARVRAALLAIHTAAEESLELRRRALEALANTHLDDVPALIAAAYQHPEEKMRVSAVFAMGRSADNRWRDIVLHELLNIQPEMRFEATRACGELMLREAAPALVDLVKDADVEIQMMALWSLGQVGGDLARRTLQHYVRSHDEAIQTTADAALQELDFFHGDLDTFFGPPGEFDGTSDVSWDSEEDEDAWP